MNIANETKLWSGPEKLRDLRNARGIRAHHS